MDFTDKVVIVTGASRGLGQEYARQFACLGANVAVCDLRDCSETLALVQAEGRVRVTARLLGRDDEYLWAEIYEQDLADVLLLQQELAVKIVREVLKGPGGV